jgi:uncharacterized protein
MIPDFEIKENARSQGIPTSTVERDYAQGWFLNSISGRLEMALKGGTGIRKIYIEGYRFSDDLDFTLLKKYPKKEIQERLNEATINCGRESGISFQRDISVKKVENGFSANVYFRILRSSGYPLRIKLDFTTTEKEVLLLSPWTRTILHPYSDELNSEIHVYRLEEIFSEKIRSLFERTRPRDLYDVWRLMTHKLDVSNLVKKKFDNKQVEFNVKELFSRRAYFRGSWENSLSHQMKELPSFKPVLQAVIDFLEKMKYLF